MTADQVVRAAMDKGVLIAWKEGGIKVTGKSDAVQSMLLQLRRHKAEIEMIFRPQIEEVSTPKKGRSNAPANLGTHLAPPEPPANPAQWRELSKAYHAHHFNCAACQAAGRGSQYGQRCTTGLALWGRYDTSVTQTTNLFNAK